VAVDGRPHQAVNGGGVESAGPEQRVGVQETEILPVGGGGSGGCGRGGGQRQHALPPRRQLDAADVVGLDQVELGGAGAPEEQVGGGPAHFVQLEDAAEHRPAGGVEHAEPHPGRAGGRFGITQHGHVAAVIAGGDELPSFQSAEGDQGIPARLRQHRPLQAVWILKSEPVHQPIQPVRSAPVAVNEQTVAGQRLDPD